VTRSSAPRIDIVPKSFSFLLYPFSTFLSALQFCITKTVITDTTSWYEIFAEQKSICHGTADTTSSQRVARNFVFSDVLNAIPRYFKKQSEGRKTTIYCTV
jgi:hypothetical protein